MDTYFSGQISIEEMRMMCDKYDNDLAELQERLKAVNEKEKAGDTTSQRQDEIKKQLADIISCNPNSFVFAQNVLDKMVVYQDNHVDLTLNNLPQKWIFDLTLQRKNAKEKGETRKAEPALSVNTDQSCT